MKDAKKKENKIKKTNAAMKISMEPITVPCVCTQCGAYTELENFEASVKIKCKKTKKITGNSYEINKQGFLMIANVLQKSNLFNINFSLVQCVKCGSDMLIPNPPALAKLISILIRNTYKLEKIIENSANDNSTECLELQMYRRESCTVSQITDPLLSLAQEEVLNNEDKKFPKYEVSYKVSEGDSNKITNYSVKFYKESNSKKKSDYSSSVKVFIDDYKKVKKSLSNKKSKEDLNEKDIQE